MTPSASTLAAFAANKSRCVFRLAGRTGQRADRSPLTVLT